MTREEAIKELKQFSGTTQLRLSANFWTALDMAIKALEQEPCEDVMAIHTQGLDEGIRCAMCTNSMKSNRGCDGGCVVNEGMYREVMNTIEKHIVPSVTPTRKKGKWITKPHIYGVTFCSECGFELKINNTNFCPNCGAEMEDEE